MAEPDENELIVLTEFRELIAGKLELTEEEGQNEMFLLAWLRARDLDVGKAYDMLEQSLEWRKENDIANILKWNPPKTFSTEFEYSICGQSVEGCPVALIPFGKWDIRKAVDTGFRNDWLKYIDLIIGQLNLKAQQNIKELDKVVTQFILIFDFDDFRMRQLTSFSNLNTICEMVRRYESNYPEVLHAAYIVNASRLFTILFRCVKPFLSARTLGKIEIYGGNEEEWKKVLLSGIPPDQLPVQYGGTQVDI